MKKASMLIIVIILLIISNIFFILYPFKCKEEIFNTAAENLIKNLIDEMEEIEKLFLT